MLGTLLAGSVGDILGRRKVMLFACAWFSIGMGITAQTTSTPLFAKRLPRTHGGSVS